MKNKDHHRVFIIPLTKNKKGDIPITILVIGVVAVCALALLSFLSSSFDIEQSFAGVALMEEINSEIDEYYFYKNMGFSEDRINEILDIREDSGRKYLYLEENKTIFRLGFPLKKEEFLFSVEYLIP